MSQVKVAISWFVLELSVSPELEEIVTAILWEEGTLGITLSKETPESITLQAYFNQEIDVLYWQNLLQEMFINLGYSSQDLKEIKQSEVPNEDWLKKWKENYRPVNVGEKFLITPSWLRSEVTDTKRIIIEIDPKMAFGTGTHETTQLCLKAIEDYWQGGSCLDVGCGTGILAMAAAKLYPDARVVACDNDPEAITVAEENLDINKVENLKLSVGSASDYCTEKFSLVVANLTADVIASIINDLTACLAEKGQLILSGILADQKEQVCSVLSSHKQKIVTILSAGEWIAIVSSHQVD